MLVLASCQNVAEEAAKPETAVADSGYPNLHTVPPRPHLSYTVEQQRAIVEGLVADRENARYTSEVIRYRTGLTGLPPPEPKTLAAAPVELAPEPKASPEAPAATPGAPPGAGPTTEIIPHDDSLDSFMQEMLDSIPPAEEAQPDQVTKPEARAAPPAHEPAPAHDTSTTTAWNEHLSISPPPPAPAKPLPAPATDLAGVATQEAEGVEVGAKRAVSDAPSKPIPGMAQIDVANGLIAIEMTPGADAGSALGTSPLRPGTGDGARLFLASPAVP